MPRPKWKEEEGREKTDRHTHEGKNGYTHTHTHTHTNTDPKSQLQKPIYSFMPNGHLFILQASFNLPQSYMS